MSTRRRAANSAIQQPSAETCRRPTPVDADHRESITAGRSDDVLRQVRKMEAIGRLAGGVAHDFNNILTVITGFCDVALERLQCDDEFFEEVMEIKKASDRGASLTRQLMAFSRRRAKESRVLDLNQIIREMHKMVERLVGEDIEVRLDLSDDLGVVEVDSTQIEQVLLNLVINARDAMPHGGALRIETSNAILPSDGADSGVATSEEGQVVLAVTDAGIGIPDDIQTHLFEPFFTTKRDGRGSGFGLATTGDIVREAGGCIEVDSVLAKVTTFRVYLPRVRKPLSQPRAEAVLNPRAHGKETILLVDDEVAVRVLLERILVRCGYDVVSAGDGPEALALIRTLQRPINLLLADVVLPKTSGRQIADALVRRYPAARVLYISGYSEETILSNRVRIAEDAFLPKPFSPQTLAQRVRDVLDASPRPARSQ